MRVVISQSNDSEWSPGTSFLLAAVQTWAYRRLRKEDERDGMRLLQDCPPTPLRYNMGA